MGKIPHHWQSQEKHTIIQKTKHTRSLHPPMLILHLVIMKPGIFLREIQNQLLEVLLLEVDVSTICRFLHDSGFMRQNLRYGALQRDDYSQ